MLRDMAGFWITGILLAFVALGLIFDMFLDWMIGNGSDPE